MTIVYCNNKLCDRNGGEKCKSVSIQLSNIGLSKVFLFDCGTYRKNPYAVLTPAAPDSEGRCQICRETKNDCRCKEGW